MCERIEESLYCLSQIKKVSSISLIYKKPFLIRPYNASLLRSAPRAPRAAQVRFVPSLPTNARNQAAMDALVAQVPTPTPPPRTNRTRRVPHPVLIGHAASLTPY